MFFLLLFCRCGTESVMPCFCYAKFLLLFGILQVFLVIFPTCNSWYFCWCCPNQPSLPRTFSCYILWFLCTMWPFCSGFKLWCSPDFYMFIGFLYYVYVFLVRFCLLARLIKVKCPRFSPFNLLGVNLLRLFRNWHFFTLSENGGTFSLHRDFSWRSSEEDASSYSSAAKMKCSFRRILPFLFIVMGHLILIDSCYFYLRWCTNGLCLQRIVSRLHLLLFFFATFSVFLPWIVFPTYFCPTRTCDFVIG